jgi:hypothetical protein
MGYVVGSEAHHNHYTVAAMFTSTPATKVDAATKSRFAALFKAINNYLS